MTTPPPKYTSPEIERRWLVAGACLPDLSSLPRREIEDKYLNGGRLRLRKVAQLDAQTIYKLGKKYPSPPGMDEQVVTIYLTEEQVVTIYLTEDEYLSLAGLPGQVVSKHRYAIDGGALDVYAQPAWHFAVFEMEFASQLDAVSYLPPAFVGQEITRNARYSGFALSKSPS